MNILKISRLLIFILFFLKKNHMAISKVNFLCRYLKNQTYLALKVLLCIKKSVLAINCSNSFFKLHGTPIENKSFFSLWKYLRRRLLTTRCHQPFWTKKGCWQPVVTSHFGPKWLLTTSHIFTIKWLKMVFHFINFILICYKKILIVKANGQFYLHICIFGALCYIYMWTLSFFMYGHQYA